MTSHQLDDAVEGTGARAGAAGLATFAPGGLVAAAARIGGTLDERALVRLCDAVGRDFADELAHASDAGEVLRIGRTVRPDPDRVADDRGLELDPLVQRALHAALARALSETALDTVGSSRDRARHLRAAGDGAGAVRLLLQAAELLEHAGDLAAAVSCYDESAGILAQSSALMGSSAWVHTLERRADVATDVGDARAVGWWRELALHLAETRDPAGAARAWYQCYHAARAAGARDAARWARAAADVRDDDSGWSTRAGALLALAAGEYVTARSLDMEALGRGRAAGDSHLESLALGAIAASSAALGDLPAAIKAQREASAIAATRRDHRTVVNGRTNLVHMLLEDLRSADAIAEARALVQYVDAANLDAWRADTLGTLAIANAVTGDLDGAEEALAAARRCAGCGPSGPWLLLTRARVLLHRGLLDAMEPVLAAATAAAQAGGLQIMLSEIGTIEALRTAEGGDLIAAAHALEQLELPTEPLLAAQAAAWAARLAHVHGEARLLETVGLLAPAPSATGARAAELAAREAAAWLAFTSDLARARDLEVIADDWRGAGRMLDAGHLEYALAMALRRDGRVARATAALRRAHADLAPCGVPPLLAAIGASLRDEVGAERATASPLVSGLDAAQAAQLDLQFMTSRHDAGATFFEPGDANDLVYVVRSGRVALWCGTPDGRRLTVELLDAGDVFGEEGVLGGTGLARLTAEATEDVVVGAIRASRLRELVTEVPQLGLNLLGLVGSRLERTRALTEQVAFWTVERRLAQRLIDLDERYGHPTLDGRRIINRIFTQVELAELVNARRETVNELLKRLRAEGVIELRKRRIVILDRARLGVLLA